MSTNSSGQRRIVFIISILFIFTLCGFGQKADKSGDEASSISKNSSNDIGLSEVHFRRRSFEESALNYVEIVLDKSDNFFNSHDSYKRCYHLMDFEYVEYPYRANILRARVLLTNLGTEEDKIILSIMLDVQKEWKNRERALMCKGLMSAIKQHRARCLKTGSGSQETLNKLGEYERYYNSVLSGDDGGWKIPVN